MSRTALLLALVACTGEVTSEPVEEPVVEFEVQLPECEGESACERLGHPGTCVAERCVLTPGVCGYDVDCDDANPCTTERCDDGICRGGQGQDTSCALSGEPGICFGGHCIPTSGTECIRDDDCPEVDRACLRYMCDDGVCQPADREDDATCELPSGRDGICRGPICEASLDEDARDDGQCRTVPTVFGPVRRCGRGFAFRMSGEDLVREARRIEERLASELRYDVTVSLVPVHDGGYNILVFNRHDRSSVQGLVDPSFVAWTVGHHTAGTRWKSRNLQIWLDPYVEGWAITTSGGREAIRRGRRHSRLGFLGVVDVSTYRAWLHENFVAIEPP